MVLIINIDFLGELEEALKVSSKIIKDIQLNLSTMVQNYLAVVERWPL